MGLTSALTAALAGNEIRILDTQLDGNFFLDKSVTLYGGWDSTFLSPGAQPTALNGSLTVDGGAPTVRAVAVKGELEVHTGSLRVNGVTVGQ
jgi:hypothetical protein